MVKPSASSEQAQVNLCERRELGQAQDAEGSPLATRPAPSQTEPIVAYWAQ